MIVKNEESCLDKCLQSVKDFDEIVIVDTGSVDKTIEIAKKYTDKIYHFEWIDDFSKARNYSLSKCTGDWIFVIDADEVLISTYEQVKKTALMADKDKVKAVNVTQYSERDKTKSNKLPLLFKRSDIHWKGAIHNHLSIAGQADSNLEVEYGYSASHNYDKDRTLRILQKEVDKGGKIRELYYLGREYFYRRDYDKGIKYLNEYLKVGKYLAERADAYLFLARCYWMTSQGEEARVNCLMAININANFKEALDFMAELSWEHNAKAWREFAKLANNNNVLFKR